MIPKLPFTVIGGYLGAGKTTLLNHLLSNTQGLRIAVLVNDFGSVNIDVDLIRSHEGDTINLANGCMCCSIANNFAMVIGQLQNRAADLDHIVIEASGVANPSKIAQYGQMYQLPLDGVIIVADAEQVQTQAQNKYVGDTVLRQFAQADLVILNKTDLVSVEALIDLRQWLGNIAPGTPVFETVNAQVPTAILLGAHKADAAASPLSDPLHPLDREKEHSQPFETWTISHDTPLERDTLAHFADGMGDAVFRVKGFVWFAEDPDHRYVYQQVGPRWSLEPDAPWGDASRHSQWVVISQKGGTKPMALRALLHPKHCLA